jgi:hypothetical protein
MYQRPTCVSSATSSARIVASPIKHDSELVEVFFIRHLPSTHGVSLTLTTTIFFIKASSFWEHAEHEVDNDGYHMG